MWESNPQPVDPTSDTEHMFLFRVNSLPTVVIYYMNVLGYMYIRVHVHTYILIAK